jgi:hypothetical protein
MYPQATHTASPDGAASPLLACLERTWQAIRQQHPEVPQAVLVVASGTRASGSTWATSPPTAGRSKAPTATRSWSAAKASTAAPSTCLAPCCTRLPTASP